MVKTRHGNIVMMNGYICSLKTEISKDLASRLGIARLETKQLGKLAAGYDKNIRYRIIARLASVLGSEGKNVVIDGTFGKKRQRDYTYSAAKKAHIEDIVVVRCFCDDKSEVWRRINERGGNDDACIAEWLKMKYDDAGADLYQGSAVSLIDVDTGRYMVNMRNSRSDFSLGIKDALEDIVVSKKESRASASEFEDRMRQFTLGIAIEAAKSANPQDSAKVISQELNKILGYASALYK